MREPLLVLGLLLLHGCTGKTGGAAPEEMVEVVVAMEALPAGTQLTADQLARRRFPARLVGSSWLPAAQAEQALGQRTLIHFSAGDPILRGALAADAPVVGLPGKLGKEGRAVLVALEGPLEPHRFLAAGDRVDVVSVFRDPLSNESTAMVLLEDVAILATYRSGSQGKAGVVAVEATQKQAQEVILAMELGTVSAIVRGAGEPGPGSSRERTTVYDLMDLKAPATAPSGGPEARERK